MIVEQISLYKAHTIHILVHYLHDYYLKSEIYLLFLSSWYVLVIVIGKWIDYIAHLIQECHNSKLSIFKKSTLNVLKFLTYTVKWRT